MSLLRRGSAKQKHEARRAWLSAHLEDWPMVPGLRDDVTDANRASLDQLCACMAAIDLFGASPKALQRETVRRLLSELRGEHVGGNW
jgi:hypothetical protein